MESLHFEITSYSEAEGSPYGIPIPEHYDYWVPLMTYFIGKSDTVEIHCWNEETKTIEETKAISNEFVISYEHKLTYFKAKLTPNIIENLLYQNLTQHGELKWFSVFLSNKNHSVLNLGHWSTENTAENLSPQEIEFIKSIMPVDFSYSNW